MMSKTVFDKKVDDNNNDYELVVCGYKCSATRLFVSDNQTQESVMSLNVAKSPSGQGLLGVESLGKSQLDKWPNCYR